jgi:periplasmic divalent cation tolerance protein
VIEITTTIPSEETGAILAAGIVAQRLGACAQVSGPFTSTYRWQGCIETNREWRLIVKTTPERRDALVDYLRERHPYDVPEISVHTVAWTEPAFLEWVQAETTDIKNR